MVWVLSLVIVSKFLLGFAQVGEGICSAGGESCTVDQQQDVVVTIYSYDRPRYLLLLLEDIAREADRAELKVHVHVIDDNSIDCIYPAQQDNVYDSDSKYENDLREFSIDQKSSQFDLICPSLPRFRRVLEIVATRNWKFFSSRERHGKKRYWHQVAQAHRLLEGIQTRFFVFLPDDDRLCADFFRKAISAWEKIADTDKASLMLHVEEKRAKEAVWTPLKPVREGHVYRIGWVESGNFLCTYKLLELMNYSFPRIPSNRWDQRPTLSSGVGSQLSETLYKAKLGMFLTMSSLVAHVGNEESKMNSDLRASEQLNTYMFEDGEEALEKLLKEPPSVVATLATKWGRLRSLQSVVHSLACQVDKIHVYLNDYEFVPAFLRGLSWVHVYRSQVGTRL
uniref:Protein xylosyltransferase n=2 Tax=Rhodosorus marinus TaxID=101924 RepID=A0A7S2ZIQ2_9RHOD|mmetsp:Transcript_20946/g.85378  ORF Transcript_20946/g.85378 Transcript_20946/m.85378 type:complete len:395 (+) Transcript_20946:149-1333(+)